MIFIGAFSLDLLLAILVYITVDAEAVASTAAAASFPISMAAALYTAC